MKRWAESSSFLVGAAIAALFLLSWRVPAGDGRLGADVTFNAAVSPDVTLSATGPFVEAKGLEPGRGNGAGGSLRIWNPARHAVALRARARADAPHLDALLRVELRAGPTLLFSGPLGDLRRWTARALVVGPQRARDIELRAWLPAGVRDGYHGRVVQAGLELAARPAREQA